MCRVCFFRVEYSTLNLTREMRDFMRYEGSTEVADMMDTFEWALELLGEDELNIALSFKGNLPSDKEVIQDDKGQVVPRGLCYPD